MTDDRPRDENAQRTNAALEFVREHPLVTAIFAICIFGGAVAGAVLLTQDWSIARRLAAGAVSGAGVALLVTAPRLIG